MKRFLMLVGVAAVAAAMYVAASPASRQSRGPTAKQFKALKKQVASLSKAEKAAKKEADAAVAFIEACFISPNSGVLPVNQFGSPTLGFLFGAAATGSPPPTPRTALDIDTSTTPGGFLQGVDPSCVTSTPLRHGQLHFGSGSLQFRAERIR